jgi:uncharacterized repeat protein (TIGR02543 family)
MKRFKKAMLLLNCLVVFGTATTGCSSFIGGSEITISDVVATTDANGNTTITITFDGGKDPIAFVIPKGMSGKDGVGIKSVVPIINEDNTVTITITYTDNTVTPTVISIPLLKGSDGKSIANVKIGKDDDGNTTMQFIYTDTTSSDVYTIPKAKDGVGILTITSESSEDGTAILVKVTLSDGSDPITFSIRNGKGVESITYDAENSDTDNYALKVTYSDNSTEIIKIPRPQGTKWYSGTAVNPASTLGKVGDYYINIITKWVFIKEDFGWDPKFQISGTGESESKTFYNVIFNIDVTNGESFSDDTTDVKIKIVEEGDCIPLTTLDAYTPIKSGATFEGWYTSLTNVNAGKFTDLTPVLKETKLYAKWSV